MMSVVLYLLLNAQPPAPTTPRSGVSHITNHIDTEIRSESHHQHKAFMACRQIDTWRESLPEKVEILTHQMQHDQSTDRSGGQPTHAAMCKTRVSDHTP